MKPIIVELKPTLFYVAIYISKSSRGIVFTLIIRVAFTIEAACATLINHATNHLISARIFTNIEQVLA